MANANPFRFSTKFQDEETDLLYYGYRYYGASIGRWCNVDPLGETGGLNLHGFLANSPPDRVDVLGLIGPVDTGSWPPLPPPPPPVTPNSETVELVGLFEQALNDYCAQEIRCNCPTFGNFWISVTFGTTSYKGCHWQAVDMHQRLLDAGASSEWKLDTPATDIPPHNWVTAESDKYRVSMDTWKGCISVAYKDGSHPYQKTCYECKGGWAVKK